MGFRPVSILEHNIVQTAGSAGESIAFGIGVTMPAIMILGFDLEITRVMLVAILGGLLGILMMIPLRRALIVQQHGILKYPEGTACAEVLKAGATPEERALGRADAESASDHEAAQTGAGAIFAGFGAGVVYKLAMEAFKLWKDIPEKVFAAPLAAGSISAEISPELLGVGYIIGPKIAATMAAGGVLAYLFLIPAIHFFGASAGIIAPGTMPIAQMGPDDIRGAYVLYIGAGAVAVGGIISLFRSLPMIWRGVSGGLADWRAQRGAAAPREAPLRTDRDLSPRFVAIGLVVLVAGILLAHSLRMNILGALLIVLFGFLFVTVSSRLTGQIGSSSNPISGMTVATLLLTCLIFLALGWTGPTYYVTALSVGGIVCVAASNGGTTSQDLKTGFLVGSTPRAQQIAILCGAFASAVVLGPILLALNDASTVYVPLTPAASLRRPRPPRSAATAPPAWSVPADKLAALPSEHIKGPQERDDPGVYKVWQKTDDVGGPPGRDLVNAEGAPVWLVDPGHQRDPPHPPRRHAGQQVRRAQGDPDELHYQGDLEPAASLDPGGPRRNDRRRAGDVRHRLSGLCSGGLSAAVLVLANLHRRRGALARRPPPEATLRPRQSHVHRTHRRIRQEPGCPGGVGLYRRRGHRRYRHRLHGRRPDQLQPTDHRHNDGGQSVLRRPLVRPPRSPALRRPHRRPLPRRADGQGPGGGNLVDPAVGGMRVSTASLSTGSPPQWGSAHLLADAANVTVFTGAGISTESGVPDFRSPGGVWSRMKPIYFQDFVASEERRREAWNRAFSGAAGWTGAAPNAGHHAVAALVAQGKAGAVITQNVDDLHQASGVPETQVIELHGNASYATCLDLRPAP